MQVYCTPAQKLSPIGSRNPVIRSASRMFINILFLTSCSEGDRHRSHENVSLHTRCRVGDVRVKFSVVSRSFSSLGKKQFVDKKKKDQLFFRSRTREEKKC